MENKAIGNKVEQELLAQLESYGMWTHLLKDSASGQPFDIVAIYGDNTFCIDCKDCKAERFPFTRCEDNQINAFNKLTSTGFYNTSFVIYHNYKWYVLPYALYHKKKDTAKSVRVSDLISLENYLRTILCGN